jgi:hypothetical protein
VPEEIEDLAEPEDADCGFGGGGAIAKEDINLNVSVSQTIDKMNKFAVAVS